MSNNNRTFVPGQEYEAPAGIPNPYAASSRKMTGKGTFVPNMQEASTPAEQKVKAAAGAPIVGFLYSISNAGATEYWPIHVGANIIGRGEDADICLSEATVSTRHAQINVKQLRKSRQLVASIQDIGSKCGMMLNDEELGYESVACKNGDIVMIGDAYKLLIILVDTDALGLAPAPNFIGIEPAQEQEVEEKPWDNDATQQGYNPYNPNNSGTVDLNGHSPYMGSGHTQVLE